MKKLLAIILAISMCISLLPGFAYATGEATNDGAITYNFGYGAYGATKDISRSLGSSGYDTDNSELLDGYDINSVTLAHLDYNEVFATVNTAPWRADGHRRTTGMTLKKDELNITADARARSTPPEVHFALIIDIKEPGTYVPTLAYGEGQRGVKYDIHFMKKESDRGYGFYHTDKTGIGAAALYNDLVGTNNIGDTYKIGSVNMYNPSYALNSENKTSAELDTITVDEAGEYYVLFETVGVGDAAAKAYYTYLYSLSLEPQKIYNYNFNRGTYGATADIMDADTNANYDKEFTALEEGYDINSVTLARLDYNEVFATKDTSAWRLDGHRYARKRYSYLQEKWLHVQIEKAYADGDAHLAFLIKIDKAGTYVPTLNYGASPRGMKYDIHFMKKESDRGYGFYNSAKSGIGTVTLENDLKSFGDTYKIGSVDMYADGENYASVTDKAAELNAITVDEADVGEYYLILENTGVHDTTASYLYTYLYSFNLTDAELLLDYDADFNADEDPLAAYGAEVTTAAVATDGAVIENNTSESDDDGDGIYTISTEKTVGDYSFLYWAKGLSADKKNKVVSDALSFDYKPTEGNNWLIAVYAMEDSETASAEFYDANRQLLYSTDSGTVTVTDSTITIPALPSHPGLGQATHWELAGDEETEYGVGENTTAEFSGTMIFVAQYDNGVETVTVNGTEYDYGTPVTCTANTPEGKTFKGWIKNVNGKNELVSTSSVYKFLAWEDCRVEPIYSDDAESFGSAMKIVLDDFAVGNGTAIMAEFIGIENVVEKGIMFGTTKIAMTGDGNQFTITADEAGTYTGYAIVEDNGTYTEITDGEVVID